MVILTNMSTHTRIPTLTLGWRLKLALDYGHVMAASMADALGVTPHTLSRWMKDRGAPPRRAYIAQWALITGVDADWLEHGDDYTPSPSGGTTGRKSPVLLHFRDAPFRVLAATGECAA